MSPTPVSRRGPRNRATDRARHAARLRRRPLAEVLERYELLAASVFLVTNTNDNGVGSLRQQMNLANSTAGDAEIDFQIPASDPNFNAATGTVTIKVGPTTAGTRLPTSHGRVFINGFSEGNFLRGISNYSGPPLVVVDGTSAPFTNAFDFGPSNATHPEGSGGSKIQGMDIIHFTFDPGTNNGGTAVIIEPSSPGDVVQGNYIGVAADGVTPAPNDNAGVFVVSANNTIGGPSLADRNIISGNRKAGVVVVSVPANPFINFPPANFNLIQNNYIGTDVGGSVAIPNGAQVNGFGIGLGGANLTTVANNVISGNAGTGVLITSRVSDIPIPIPGIPSGITLPDVPTANNLIQANDIGTGANGSKALPNGGDGVFIGASANNAILSNVIAFNGKAGVGFAPDATSTGNHISQNSIYANHALGIDLNNTGVFIPNTPGGPHSGANNLQNFPVLTGTLGSGGGLTISGTLNSTPNKTFTIEFYANRAADPSFYGQGQQFLGSTVKTTDANGNATFTNVPMTNPVPGGSILSAIAIDPNGNTSEFSLDLVAGGNPAPATAGDYDGDHKTDLGVFDATTSTLIVAKSGGSGALIQQFGDPSHRNIPVSGDYDGDGRTDQGIFDATTSTLIVVPSGGGRPLIQQFGDPSHRNIPVTGDYYGTGQTDLGIYDATTSTLIVVPPAGSIGLHPLIQQFGDPRHSNIPVVGDYDGDGKADLGIYDATTSTLIVALSGGGQPLIRQFGDPTHRNVPVVGDYDGDGKADLGIFDATTSTLIVAKSGGGALVQQFGDPSHNNIPVVGDYNGDGKSDPGIFDATTSTLYVLPSGGGRPLIQQFGDPSHRNAPVPATPAGSVLGALIVSTPSAVPATAAVVIPATDPPTAPSQAAPKVNDAVLARALELLRRGG